MCQPPGHCLPIEVVLFYPCRSKTDNANVSIITPSPLFLEVNELGVHTLFAGIHVLCLNVCFALPFAWSFALALRIPCEPASMKCWTFDYIKWPFRLPFRNKTKYPQTDKAVAIRFVKVVFIYIAYECCQGTLIFKIRSVMKCHYIVGRVFFFQLFTNVHHNTSGYSLNIIA